MCVCALHDKLKKYFWVGSNRKDPRESIQKHAEIKASRHLFCEYTTHKVRVVDNNIGYYKDRVGHSY